MQILPFVLFLSGFTGYSVVGFDYDLVKSYFQYFSVNRVTIFHCDDNHFNQKLIRKFMKDNFIVSFTNMDRSIIYVESPHLVGIYADPTCKNLTELMVQRDLFRAKHFWVIHHYSNVSTLSDLGLSLLSNASIFPDSLVLWVQENNELTTFFDVYRITVNTTLVVTEVGNNINEVLTKLTKIRLKRQNLQQAYLRSALVIQFSTTSLMDLHQREQEPFLKRTNPTMKILKEDLNFSTNTIVTNDYGWMQNNSLFKGGMFGLFQTKEIDIAMQGGLIRHDRLTVCDFTAEIVQVEARIMYRQPPLSSISNIYVLPFTQLVWLCAGVMVLVIACVIVIELGLVRNHENALETLKIGDLFTFITGAICQQGFSQSPTTVSVQLTMLLFFISSLFLFTSYSANIVALLQSPSSSIRTLEDLVNSPLGVGIQNITYNFVYLTETKDPTIQQLYKQKVKIRPDKGFLDIDDGMAQVRHGMFAYQVGTSAAYDVIAATYTEAEKCGLGEIELFKLPMQAIPVQKGSPYRDIFTVRLRWQRETGLMDRIGKIWVAQRPKCESTGGGFVSVGLTEAEHAIKAFFYGAVVAVVLFVLEMFSVYKPRFLTRR